VKRTILVLMTTSFFIALPILATAEAYHITPDSLLRHIQVLAADSLEGREVGEPGELMAAQYIRDVFTSAGLEPKGTDGDYFQPFSFIKRIDLGEKNRLVLNGEELQLHEEFLPLKHSASARFEFDEIVDVDYGIKTGEGHGAYNDYEGKEVEGKAVLIKRFAPSSEDNPHINFDKFSSLTDKVNTAVAHKAAAVLFITPEDQDDTLNVITSSHVNPKDIPIIFLRRKALERLGLDLGRPALSSLDGETELIKTRDTTRNVVGYIPAANDTTVIIGAHFDHLGWGTSTSLYRGPEKKIHPGADDNGSGCAALLELARYYSSVRDQLKYSVLFIGFTGEEAGILGSSYFARNMTIDSSKVRMMVNMDMIGRLKDQENGLAILGTGTCLEFKSYFDSLRYDDLKLTFKESGTGPSDHTAFYNRKIPVLYFFTGAHSDYHKPTDVPELIDLDGIAKVTEIIRDIVGHFDRYDGALTFQKTKDDGVGKRRSQFSVTLGIMPDYIAEVEGLRVDGVSLERPGERAGILEGDIIIRMGEFEIGDIYDYMNALGKFRKGDSVTVIVERNNETVSLPVLFK